MPDYDWNIKSRSSACSLCSANFQDKQGYISTLSFTKEGYERIDSCESCWNTRDNAARQISFWRGVYHSPPAAPEETLKKETAESLLRTLIKNQEPGRINSIYILAVMLERKRLLIEKTVHKDENGKTHRIYEHRKTGETFPVADPMLTLDQIEHVQKEVSELLLHGIAPKQPEVDGAQETGDRGQETGDRGQEAAGRGPGGKSVSQ